MALERVEQLYYSIGFEGKGIRRGSWGRGLSGAGVLPGKVAAALFCHLPA